MKRARIKAMVTVPARRKTTQDTPLTEVANVTQHNEEAKNMPTDICPMLQMSESSLQVKKIEENVEAIEQTVNKQIKVEAHSNECKDDSTRHTVQSTKESVQQQETSNAPENSNDTN